ncbi:MAG: cupin domain-containing protein [Gammaproteobacteria bacterium]
MNRILSKAAKFSGLLLATFTCIALAQQRGGFLSNFTGEISIVDSEDMRSSRIRFEAGARTNWHLHSEPQLLLIEEGEGRWQEQGGPVHILAAGEPVLTRGAVSHWHGAAPDQAAVQFSVYSGTLEWQAPVTDDQYLDH